MENVKNEMRARVSYLETQISQTKHFKKAFLKEDDIDRAAADTEISCMSDELRWINKMISMMESVT